MNRQLDDLANAALDVWAFPLQPRSKEPVRSFLREPPSREDLEAHLAAGGNLAIRTGFIEGCSEALVVLDLDPAKPDKPAPEWSLTEDGKELTLPQGRIALPATWCQRTGGGGLQLFFQVSADDLVASTAGNAGAVAAGVDWRSFHNYVAAPPSIHPNGRPYEWIHGPADLPEPAELPMELRELLLASKGSKRSRRAGIIPYSTGDCPSREDLEALRTKDGKPQLWIRSLVSSMKKKAAAKSATPAVREGYEAVSGESMPPPKGQRHDALVRIAGTLASYLGEDPAATPERVLALLVPFIEKIDPATCDEDPFEHAWKPINCFLARAEAEAEEAEQEQAARAEELEAERAEILEAFKAKNPTIQVETIEDVFGFLFLRDGRGNYCVLRPDGFYSAWTAANSLRPEIEDLWKNKAFPVALVSFTQDGREIEKRASEFTSGRSVRVDPDASKYTLEVRGTSLERTKEGYRLIRPRAYIDWDLCQWDDQIDTYLRLKYSPEEYDLLFRWNAQDKLYPKRPCAILDISGPPGSGKSMEAIAHAEARYNFGGHSAATDKSFGHFSEELKGNACAIVEEEFQVPPAVLRKQAKRLTEMVSKGVTVEEKYKNKEFLADPTRAIFAANSKDPLKRLVSGVGTADEEKALADRILALTPLQAGEDYLRSIGNYDATQRTGQEWIDGKKRFAGHFLAMAKKASEDPVLMAEISRERFGVRGNFAAGIHEAAFDDPDLLQVVRAICAWGERVKLSADRAPSTEVVRARPYALESLIVEGAVEITAHEIEAWLRDERERVPERSKMRTILARLAADPKEPFRLDKKSRRKVYRLSLEEVLKVAEDAGYPTTWADTVLAIEEAEREVNKAALTAPPPTKPVPRSIFAGIGRVKARATPDF